MNSYAQNECRMRASPPDTVSKGGHQDAKIISVIAMLLFSASLAAGHRNTVYEVTITNITPGQSFTPFLVATHSANIAFFEFGQPAWPELGVLAESGDILPLKGVLEAASHYVLDTAETAGLLGPGQSVSVEIEGNFLFRYLSFAAMLVPTHDTFVAVNALRLPLHETTVSAIAHDAGTELNDELCANIPGPYCMGAGTSLADGEGFVQVANGIHGIGDLDPAVFDWRNPVAEVTVRRVR